MKTKTIKYKVLLAVVGFGLSLAGSTAFAAGLSASSSIDYSFALFETTSGDATLNFGDPTFFSQTAANFIHQDPNHLFITEGGGSVTADASALPLGTNASTSIQNVGFGDANAQIFLDYTATGTGTVDISIPYALSIELSDFGLDPNVIVDPSTTAFALAQISEQGTNNLAEDFLQVFASDGNGFFGSFGDQALHLALSVIDGQSGTLILNSEVNAELVATVVPVPVPLVLMASGLIGLFGLGANRRVSG